MVQRRLKEKRPVISVSLDPEDFSWIQSIGGTSQSYTASRMIRAARLAGLTLEEAISPSKTLKEFKAWLKVRRRTSKVAAEMLELLSEFLEQ